MYSYDRPKGSWMAIRFVLPRLFEMSGGVFSFKKQTRASTYAVMSETWCISCFAKRVQTPVTLATRVSRSMYPTGKKAGWSPTRLFRLAGSAQQATGVKQVSLGVTQVSSTRCNCRNLNSLEEESEKNRGRRIWQAYDLVNREIFRKQFQLCLYC